MGAGQISRLCLSLLQDEDQLALFHRQDVRGITMPKKDFTDKRADKKAKKMSSLDKKGRKALKKSKENVQSGHLGLEKVKQNLKGVEHGF